MRGILCIFHRQVAQFVFAMIVKFYFEVAALVPASWYASIYFLFPMCRTGCFRDELLVEKQFL